MLAKLGDRISAFFRASAPDPFVLAILLTFLTLTLAALLTPATLHDAVRFWSSSAKMDVNGAPYSAGIWNAGLLRFAMQMCLILVTGHALASSPPIARIIRRLADLPRNGAQAVFLVGITATSLAVLNWGLGLIAGALIARDVARSMRARNIPFHYPLLCAAGYLGLLVWHGGFSGSAPLKVTQASEIADIFPSGAPFDAIPLTQTILSPMNGIITGGLVIGAPILLALMSPKDPPAARIPESIKAESPDPDAEHIKEGALPKFLETSPLINLLIVALIAWWALDYYLPRTESGSLDLANTGLKSLTPDTVNMTMLMLGLLLHWNPRSYLDAVSEAARGCAGIILQFPLYAGIMGIMLGSGLTVLIAETIASNATATTLPIFTFISAGVVNMFVPSGGGQWAVQGPIAMQAGLEAGVDPAKMVMSVAYGDQLTNMLQPFWALPLLAITGAKAREIVGYTAIAMTAAALWIVIWLLIF